MDCLTLILSKNVTLDSAAPIREISGVRKILELESWQIPVNLHSQLLDSVLNRSMVITTPMVLGSVHMNM